MLEELTGKPRVVGVKQSRRAISQGQAAKVFLADDADPALTEPIAARCAEEGVPVTQVSSMLELGRACQISVSAAAAALVR